MFHVFNYNKTKDPAPSSLPPDTDSEGDVW